LHKRNSPRETLSVTSGTALRKIAKNERNASDNNKKKVAVETVTKSAIENWRSARERKRAMPFANNFFP